MKSDAYIRPEENHCCGCHRRYRSLHLVLGDLSANTSTPLSAAGYDDTIVPVACHGETMVAKGDITLSAGSQQDVVLKGVPSSLQRRRD